MLASNFLAGSNFWLNYIAAIGFSAGTIWGTITYVHRRWVKQVAEVVGKKLDDELTNKIAEEVKEIHYETQSNGGGSMKDSLARIERSQEELQRYIQKVDKALERHLGYHEGANE
jgi:hypothetical protein